MKPTTKRLREVFHYDKNTGFFHRKKKTGYKGRIGAIVGGLKQHGYISIQIDRYRDYAHRFAWLWVTGKWPKEIDHINGNRSDNRWINLREATRFQNNGNRKLAFKYKNYHLPKGVIQFKTKTGELRYSGRITIRGKQVWFSRKTTIQEAHKDYMTAAQKYFGEFARAK